MTGLDTLWPQSCGCVLSIAVDRDGTIHTAAIERACALHAGAGALRAAADRLVTRRRSGRVRARDYQQLEAALSLADC
jgi:hypothetical protein